MKQLLYTLAASLLTCQAMAQITISSSPTINAPFGDSCNLPTPSALATLPSLAPVINGSWDLGSTVLQPAPFTYIYKAKTAGFSSASFSDSLSNDLSAAAGLSYASWRNVQQSSTGVVVLGEEILKRQAKGLGAITLNGVDSIIFPAQAIAFNNSLPILKFPATMSSKWSATANRVVNFNLTVTASGLNNAPGQHKQIRTSIDSVVGWGRMKVPIVGKGASAWIPVLQVQHSEMGIDSFFLNGSPAPAALLTAIGVSQGQSNTVARTFFYRAGAFRPLVEAVHSAPAHSSSVSRLYMHAVGLPEAVAVQSMSATGEIRVYPNPIRNGKLQIEVPDNAVAGWNYTLINMNGQLMAQGALPLAVAGRSAELSLPKNIQAGIYYLTLVSGQGQASVLPVTVE